MSVFCLVSPVKTGVIGAPLPFYPCENWVAHFQSDLSIPVKTGFRAVTLLSIPVNTGRRGRGGPFYPCENWGEIDGVTFLSL